MSFKSNLHMHSLFSDGKSSAEEYAEEAVKQGYTSIGFSEHSFTEFDDSFCMNRENREKYFAAMPALKEKYAGRLEIYMGTEFDVFSDIKAEELEKYDYVLGACHYVDVGEEKRGVDHLESVTVETIEKYFRGDAYAYCKKYFGALAKLSDIPEVDVIAHFDLVAKFNEGEKYFSETHPRYVMPALVAMERLTAAGKIIEINTGAISRGYRTTPYPSAFLLSSLYEMGGKITFSSDAHKVENMGYYFDESIKIAKECGFDHAYMLKGGKFTEVEI